MTTTMPPHGPGSRRAVPSRLTEVQRDRLRWLLEDPDHWVLRPDWDRYLLTGERRHLVRTDALTRGQRVAALAWLVQQQHALHAVLEGGMIAPDGWIDAFGLTQRLRRDT